MLNITEVKKSLGVSLWFMFLTFPVMVIRVNPIEKVVEWRWENLFMVGLGSFFLSFLWRYLIKRKEGSTKKIATGEKLKTSLFRKVLNEPKYYITVLIIVGVSTLLFPFTFSIYQINIMTTVLMYVMLGLGLNIVVGLAGLLDLAERGEQDEEAQQQRHEVAVGQDPLGDLVAGLLRFLWGHGLALRRFGGFF